MAWSVLQSASHNADVSPGTSVSATFTTSNCVSGSKIIALVVVSDSGTGNVTVTSVKDGGGTSWTQLATAAYSNGDGNIYLFALDTPAGDVGTKPTITAATTNVGSGTAASILIMEVSGLLAGNTSAMLDGTAGTSTGSGGASTTSPTYSSSASNEFLLAVYGDYEDVSCTWTNPAGYTGATAGPGSAGAVTGINSSFSANAELAYKNSTGASESASFGMNASVHWATMLVAFKLAGGGGPTSGPQFFPAVEAVRARVPLGVPRAGDAASKLAAGTGNVSGPVTGSGRGGGGGASGATVRNPTRGPVFRQQVRAVRAQFPAGFRAGRCYSTRAPAAQAPVPSAGPVFRQRTTPVRFILPPWQPRAGRIGSSSGAPVINPLRGPPVYAAAGPVRARTPLPPRGRTGSNAGGPVQNPAPSGLGPAFFPFRWPARIRPSLPPRGRVSSGAGAPARNPSSGPPFRPLPFPVRPKTPLFRLGRVEALPGAPVRNPSPGPQAYPAQGPVRARLPQFAPRAGRVTSNPGAPVRNPSTGPVFIPAPRPARAPVPQVFSKGRTASNPGSAPRNPRQGPVFEQAAAPARAVIPQTFSKGRTASNPGAAVQNPQHGPAFRQAAAPARIRPSLPPRGRISSSPGGPVQNPVPVSGPPLHPLTQAVRAQPAGRPGLVYAAITVPGTAAPASSGPALAQPPAKGGAAATSLTVTLPQATTAGNCLIVLTLTVGSAVNGAVSGITLGGSAGNFGFVASEGSGSDHAIVSAWADPSCAGGQTAVAISTSGSSGSAAIAAWVYEVSGLPATLGALLDQTAVFSSTGFVTSWALGPTSATAQASEIWFAIIGGNANQSTAITLSPSTPGWTNASQQNVNNWDGLHGLGGITGYQVVSSTGTASYDGSAPSPGTTLDGLIVTLKAAAPQAAAPSGSSYSSFATGRISFSYGITPANPVQGPAFRQATAPVRARLPLPARGRTAGSPGGPVQNPVPGNTGPVFRQATSPARIRPALPPRGRAAGSQGAAVRNPASGPRFAQAVQPARIRPSLPPRGRTGSDSGIPAAAPPAGVSSGQPAGIRVIYAYTGRARSTPQARAPQNPSRGPAFRQATSPVQARLPLPPRGGRTAGSPGGPVRNPAPPVQGPVFFPLHWPARARIPQNAPRGRVSGNPGALVRNPARGAAFPAAHGPVQARLPQQPFLKGRAAANPGTPAANPSRGPAFRPAVEALRARLPVPFLKGRAAGNPGAPVRNPGTGPAIPQAGQPVRARFPLPPKGRAASSPGAPLVTSGPRFTQFTQPVRARFPLPPRGRTGSNPGIPVIVVPPPVGPRFTPRHDPARIRPSLPPRGRITANPGGPVRNPSHGPRFIQAVQPARARIPQNAPRGRTRSNPGGPVANIPVATLLFRLGSPYPGWDTGTPALTSDWTLGTPALRWDTGVPETSS